MSILNCQTSISSPKTFDPFTHVPPKYDIYGYLKQNKHFHPQDNLFSSNQNLKLPWKDSKKGEENNNMTQTKLFEARRLSQIPDISYDLDKDGYVGCRDYVIAKRYDIDGDGKLNDEEKAAAYEGINNHIESNYKWNVDSQGKSRPFRILQKRGVIVDSEDFLPIQDTYPEHPNKQLIPRVATFTELKDLRMKEVKKSINEKLTKWELNNSNKVMLNDNAALNNAKLKRYPSHQSLREIKIRMHKEARIKCGLNEIETENKDTSCDPTLAYINEPQHKTIHDIKDDLKNKDKEEVKKLTFTNKSNKDDVTRLNEREDEIFSKLFNKEDSKTFTKIKEQRKRETLNYNMNVFSNQTIGVHGHELPKFSQSQSTIDFWKRGDEYQENPKVISHTQLKENIKYWKKPEELLLNEHKEYIYSTDPYQRTYEKKDTKDNLLIKVNKINVFKGFDPDHVKEINLNAPHQIHTYRWSSLVHQFSSNKFRKGRFFDSIAQGDSQNPNTKLDSMHNLSPDLNFFDKKNKEEKKKLESNLPSEIESKFPKDNLFQKFALSPNGSEGNILMKTAPIKTKAF